MRKLTVTPLGRDKIAQAYPLVRHSDPELSLERWDAFASELLEGAGERPQGIMTVISEQGYILGLFSYRVETDLRHMRVLTAENFHAMDLLDPQIVASTLAKCLDSLAMTHGCRAIHTALAPGTGQRDHWVSALLENIGHEVECVRFCKLLASA
jgi:hypothetical protein